MRTALLAILGTAGLLTASSGWASADDDLTGASRWRSSSEIYTRRGFDVEVRAGSRLLERLDWRGQRYVEAVAGAEYELRIINPLADRVAVVVSVDGLNTIDAKRATARDASKWLIGPYQSITLNGWQMSSERARQFVFTTERDSYASKLGRLAEPGVISAVFFRERKSGAVFAPEHRDEPSHFRSESRGELGGTRPSAGLEGAKSERERSYAPDWSEDRAATGIGRSVSHEVRSVEMDLESSPVAEVTIRYEYRHALIRLGVLPRVSSGIDETRKVEDRRFCPEP